MRYDYDTIYGITLEEYYDYLDKHIEPGYKASDFVIRKTELEIELLEKNRRKLLERRDDVKGEKADELLGLIRFIYELIDSKRRHLERLRKWK